MKALTVGGAMIDTIAIVDPSRIERMTMLNAETSYLLLAQGHKTEALEISTHCGGGAVNTAVALARLGHDVAAIVKLGRDERAETIYARLMAEGVSTRHIVRDERAATGASVIISSHDRNAAIFTFRGANTLLEEADLKPDAFAVDLVHVASLSGGSADRFTRIIAMAKDGGAFVSTNPGLRQLSSRGAELARTLPKIDLITINKTEAAALVPGLVVTAGEGGPPLSANRDDEPPSALARHGLTAGGYHMSLKAFVRALVGQGVARVLVTDGAAGAYLGDAEAIRFCPALKVPVSGTAGAGDAFAATLASELARGTGPEEALRAAALNSAHVVQHIDTQSGLLTRAKLETAAKQFAPEPKVRTWPL